MTSVVYRTAVASLLVQIAIGAVTAAGFAVDIPDRTAQRELDVILGLELGSQVVEFVWYLYVLCQYTTIQTWTRYLDWVISTPIMLVSTVLFFSHRDSGDTTLWSPLTRPTLYLSLIFNWVMLVLGFLAETERIERALGLTVVGIDYVASFTLLSVELDDADSCPSDSFGSSTGCGQGTESPPCCRTRPKM